MELTPIRIDEPPATGLHPIDLSALLAETTPGATYTAEDTYTRYAEITRANGRTPCAKRTLGSALARYADPGRHRVPGRANAVRTWTFRATP